MRLGPLNPFTSTKRLSPNRLWRMMLLSFWEARSLTKEQYDDAQTKTPSIRYQAALTRCIERIEAEPLVLSNGISLFQVFDGSLVLEKLLTKSLAWFEIPENNRKAFDLLAEKLSALYYKEIRDASEKSKSQRETGVGLAQSVASFTSPASPRLFGPGTLITPGGGGIGYTVSMPPERATPEWLRATASALTSDDDRKQLEFLLRCVSSGAMTVDELRQALSQMLSKEKATITGEQLTAIQVAERQRQEMTIAELRKTEATNARQEQEREEWLARLAKAIVDGGAVLSALEQERPRVSTASVYWPVTSTVTGTVTGTGGYWRTGLNPDWGRSAFENSRQENKEPLETEVREFKVRVRKIERF